jgi:N-acetylneuraminate synthase
MEDYFYFGNRKIGLNEKPLVIAEIGINHGGSLISAIKIAKAAIDSGAEVIKHQTHIPHDEMSSEAKKIIPGHTKQNIYKIISDCALNESDEKKLMDYVLKRGKVFISTPFSRLAVDRLIKFKVPFFKIGSGECNNYPLIEYISKFKKPVILSTGMNDIHSIQKSVGILVKNNIKYALLHTTNVYPTPPNLVRLQAIKILKEKFPKVVVGLSDHTTSIYTSLAAVALGACIIEKHFTDSKKRSGPDISSSMDPNDLKSLLNGIEIIHSALYGDKKAVKEELPTIKFAFASVVAIKNIRKGDRFSYKNLWVKRPGNGYFKADKLKFLIGKTAKFDISFNTQIKKNHVKF